MVSKSKILFYKIILSFSIFSSLIGLLFLDNKNTFFYEMLIMTIISILFSSTSFFELNFIRDLIKDITSTEDTVDLYNEGTLYFLIPIFCFVPSFIISIFINRNVTILSYDYIFLLVFIYIQNSIFYFVTLLFCRVSIHVYILNKKESE